MMDVPFFTPIEMSNSLSQTWKDVPQMLFVLRSIAQKA
ncbi:hypothetical protein EUX98_g9530 [Antrodiella citrinella]|uniref:Uncharacterized protein n=1 Tax=Antrodiella citrinella TaxID=2447956 RepID=A0A4S4LS67_9APHY|nr:hypothetical protein EUX98_g9530 [Antrodiella citrinella]